MVSSESDQTQAPPREFQVAQTSGQLPVEALTSTGHLKSAKRYCKGIFVPRDNTACSTETYKGLKAEGVIVRRIHVTWNYPFIPGEPSRQVTTEQVVCITSEPDITGAICSDPTVNWSMIYAPSGERDYLTTTNITSTNGTSGFPQWYWCQLPYFPLEEVNRTVTPPGDGNGPASLTAWETSFNSTTSPAQRESLDIVFVCRFSASDGSRGRRYFSAATQEETSAAAGSPSVVFGSGYLLLLFWVFMRSVL
ncbi:hypothetical protein FFLO_05570 [Filobasidium floriforme]|uniref:Uncharacterized protein n=1 Tax=Filobasidium floriforme TaxID=5210 RepID=A0A8K0JGL1_9TREE|nr:uncharacterized protein HD553DRAFT_326689 [Filobasidium floriforme]KAG7529554.1 hypothetical protein FFLO_05570 [Filobasidium floriforme]KAH8078976.1 hypothetical protein HD553DRAFT_326689 [Filobasidium floriforme]